MLCNWMSLGFFSVSPGFALKKQTKVKLPTCKKDDKVQRKLKSISAMRIPHDDELKSAGYGQEQKLAKVFLWRLRSCSAFMIQLAG